MHILLKHFMKVIIYKILISSIDKFSPISFHIRCKKDTEIVVRLLKNKNSICRLNFHSGEEAYLKILYLTVDTFLKIFKLIR